MHCDLVIQNGTVVTADAAFRADVGIRGERIAAVAQQLTGTHTLDASGKLVTPGAVDVHVHMQMPLGSGVRTADDFFTGTRAAALGGTTSMIDFVAAGAEQSLGAALADRRAQADPRVVIDYGLHMTITPPDLAKLDQLPALAEAGCSSVKLYMAYDFHLKDDQLFQALQAARDAGCFPVVHAENWAVIQTLAAQYVAAGHTDPRWHPRSRPAILEGEAAGRVIDMARLLEMPLYIFHVSCAEVVERIACARQRGLPIFGETCPQYLFLTEDRYAQPGVAGAQAVCAPPLRTAADQERLWRALAQNDLQVVSTDHCPFFSADKARGRHDFRQIPGGVPSIETRFALLYSGGVQRGILSPSRWVELCCTSPARLFGLAQKGVIAPGYDADLVIFDPAKRVRLASDVLHEQVDWTPYAGIEVQGWPIVTLSRGEIIAENGTFHGGAGRGQFLVRQPWRLS